MKSRILFLSLLTFMLVASSFAIYWMFFKSTEHALPGVSADSRNKSVGTGSPEKAREHEEGRSIWADPRLRGLSGTGLNPNSEKAKEIESNLRTLVSLYDQGEDKQFLERLDQLIAANPDAKEYLALKGDYFFNEGKWPEAEAAVRDLISKDSENMFARTTLAEIQAAQGKLDDALATQQEVITKDPNNADALNGALAVTEMQGKPEKGEEIVRNHAMAHLSNGTAVAPYIDLLRGQGKSDEANRILEQSKKLDPNNPDLLQREAVSFIQQGKIPEAIAAADQAVNNSPNQEAKIIALNVKYLAAYSTRNLSIMEQVTEEVRSLDPNHISLADMREKNEMLKKN